MKPKRQPVKPVPVNPNPWATEVVQRVMGVDPGYGFTGEVILERMGPGQPIHALQAGVIRTKPTPKKKRRNLRVTADDIRRYREIWTAFDLLRNEYNPYSLGVEVYTMNPRKVAQMIQGGKTMGVYVGTLTWGFCRGLFTSAYLPGDLKQRFCGKMSATKEEVRQALYKQVIGLTELMRKIPEKLWEHVGDAAGHAVLALEETDDLRKQLGLV